MLTISGQVTLIPKHSCRDLSMKISVSLMILDCYMALKKSVLLPLANSEIEHIFNDVVDKNANNSFVLQKKKSIPNILWNRQKQSLKKPAEKSCTTLQLMYLKDKI